MRTLTIKNIPDELYSRLKQNATHERRSMNNQAIACLERALQLPPVDVEQVLARTRTIRRQTTGLPLTDRLLERAKRDGRP
ncbi:MAG: hypothetical protein OXC18_22560 [Desulfurellaceae bacterium]|nr:hypothetical protein [Desulfurellaceae bacterium]